MGKAGDKAGSQGETELATEISPEHSVLISHCCFSSHLRSMGQEPGQLSGFSFTTEKDSPPPTLVFISKLSGQVSDGPNLGHMVPPGLEEGRIPRAGGRSRGAVG